MVGIPTELFSGGNRASITQLGQQVTAPFAYDLVVAKTLETDNVAVTFYEPRVDNQFVVTGILLTADSNVTGSALIDIFETAAEGSGTIDKAILHVEILKNGNRDITGLNILVTEGKHINAKTDDDDVFVTIMGYYIPSVPENQ